MKPTSVQNKTLVFLDVETTGLDPTRHEIIEFACVFPHEGRVSFKMHPEHIETADPKALEVNGYSPERWSGYQTLTQKQGAEVIAASLRDCVLAGYNVSFDLDFINATLARHDVKVKLDYHKVDVVALAYEHLMGLGLTSLSLKNVCHFLRVPPEPAQHEALNGALACRAVYRKLRRAGWLRRLYWRLRNR